MNNKGFMGSLWVILILAFVLIGLVCAYFVWSLSAPIFTKVSGDITPRILNSVSQSNDADLTSSLSTSLNASNNTMQNLEWIGYTILIFLFLTFIMICFYVRSYPFLIVIWFMLMMVVAFVSLILTISYQQILAQGGFLTDAYTSWTTNNYIMNYLPHIIVVVGVIGGIVLFILASRDQEGEVVGI